MNWKQNYDERQLRARGTAYQFATLAFILELFLWCFLRELAIVDAAPLAELLILLTPPFVVMLSVCIVKDAYDPIGSRPGLILFGLMPLTAILMFLVKINEHVVLMDGNRITEDCGIIFLYAAWIIVAAVYWIKLASDRRQKD